MWDGYPFYLNILHSLQNSVSERIAVVFDEIDINKDDIILNNPLADFSLTDFGILQTNFNDNVKVIEDNTRFIRFNANTSGAADYLTGDYNDSDYST